MRHRCNITPSLASMMMSKAVGNVADTDFCGQLLCEFRIFNVRARLTTMAVMGMIARDLAVVNASTMGVTTVFCEVSISFTTYTLCEDDAVLWTVVGLLAPDAELSDG